MSTAVMQPATQAVSAKPRELTLYSHSAMFYWWPVWAVGFLFAILTYFGGEDYTFVAGDVTNTVRIHPNKLLGVIFTFTFFMVIMMTHFAVRGLASITLIISFIALSFALAYFELWDPVLRAFGHLVIYANLGFYVFFSSAILIAWVSAVFFFDRSTYYIVRPGQLVHATMFGSGEETFDTHGMSVEKKRDDLFRHWVLGLGSGDLHIVTTGAKKADFVIPNVLFIGSKLELIQELVATKPDQLPNTVLTAGDPV